MAHATKIAARACANGVGFQENPTAATRMHAMASHRAVSRIAQRPSSFMFSVVIGVDLRSDLSQCEKRRRNRNPSKWWYQLVPPVWNNAAISASIQCLWHKPPKDPKPEENLPPRLAALAPPPRWSRLNSSHPRDDPSSNPRMMPAPYSCKTPMVVMASMTATRKWTTGCAVTGTIVATLIAIEPPAWILMLIGSAGLALLYTIARLGSRYDPLDPRFGGCIPPINTRPRDQ